MLFLRIILISFICLSFSSCKENEKERIARLVGEWAGREVIFPSHPVFTIQGSDTVDFNYRQADYKIVTYVDSVGCTGCKLQLPLWSDFVAEVNSLTQGNVPFVFCFHPRALKEMKYLLHLEGFEYPVFLDVKDEFNRLNQFPNDMTFQTFLLDKENKIVSIGNPIHNPKVKALYLKHISGQCTSGDDSVPKK